MAFGEQIIITGKAPNVRLAAIVPEDLQDLQLADIPPVGGGSNAVARHLRPNTIAVLRRMVERGADSGLYQAMRDDPSWLAWGIFSREGIKHDEKDRLVGFVGVSNVHTVPYASVRTGQSLAYILSESHLGKRIGSRVMPMVAWALMHGQSDFAAVTAHISPQNVGSMKIYEAVGCVDIGQAAGDNGRAGLGHRELIQINTPKVIHQFYWCD